MGEGNKTIITLPNIANAQSKFMIISNPRRSGKNWLYEKYLADSHSYGTAYMKPD